MTTIEERARQYADDNYLNCYQYDGLEPAYIAGATEQKAIMLDNLKECMNGLMLDTRVKERLYEYLDKD